MKLFAGGRIQSANLAIKYLLQFDSVVPDRTQHKGEVGMQYRKFGKLDWRASALGFGAMRLPVVNGDYARIDEPEATRMLHYAIDHGVNYVDTAIHYHGSNSERFLGRALKGGYREKIKLATKLFPPYVERPQDFDRLLVEQLAKLQTSHVDFYLLHGINRRWWPKIRDLGVLDWAEGAIADGRIGHLGFSFHDDYPVFQEIVDTYDNWAMCQIQYNYMNGDYQAGTNGLKYAASKGLAIVVMEPLLGGVLASAPRPVQELWDTAPNKRTPAAWGLQWLWNQPEVSVILSGMSTMQQVEENVASAGALGAGTLGEEELALVDRVREAYRELGSIPCTACGYCMPCPNGVDIPYNFKLYNDGLMYERENPRRARRWYWFMAEAVGFEGDYHREKGQAAECVQCRECEEKCPQNIPISAWMPIVHQVLGEGIPYDETSKVPGRQKPLCHSGGIPVPP
jgi:predicted aldo/keto reductase-like oxidoreductase